LANSSRRDDEPRYFDESNDDPSPDRHCWGWSICKNEVFEKQFL
jgi:hypothetical protein